MGEDIKDKDKETRMQYVWGLKEDRHHSIYGYLSMDLRISESFVRLGKAYL